MFLLVSVRRVGAHQGEHQHGVSIQISISLDKTFLRISRTRNILLTWILARVFVYVPSFISQILDFIYWKVLIFILIYFKWRDTENQQYRTWAILTLTQTAISSESCLTTAIKVSSGIYTSCMLMAIMVAVAAFIDIWITQGEKKRQNKMNVSLKLK